MRSRGAQVSCPDLPGLGLDQTPISKITMKSYVERVCDALVAFQEPAIVVGHSMGGVVITQASEYCSGKIRKLVFLSSYILKDGETFMKTAPLDVESPGLSSVIFDRENGTAYFKAEMLKDLLYGDCSDDDILRARKNLVPNAVAPLEEAMHLSENGFGRVPKVYITTLHDKIITPAFQKRMYSNTRCEEVIAIESSHSPFFSKPAELAEILLSIGKN